MTSTERNLRIKKIEALVHQKPDISRYNSTIVRNNTNCYSYAIGSSYPYLELYRVGAICGKKPIDQEFFSVGEIINLLCEDLKVLNLKIEQSSKSEIISSNQYKIAVFVKIYADNKIHDYHFLRFDENGWSEKFRGQLPRNLGNDFQGFYNYWPWNFVGIFKVTK